METFGEWLRQQREQLKLNRKEFSDRVGCSVALLRKIEDGERRPSAQIAELIANTLSIPPGERPTFIKAARGELSADILPSPAGRPTAAARQSNLPVLPTPVIGREREVEELSQLLREPECRLLTLTGAGGTGKTRLAIEVAEQAQADFADGVYFAAFTPVNSTRYLVPVIADAVGFAFESASKVDPKVQLFNYLHEKQILILTDNLEQLLAEPGIELLGELLAHARLVKLLATSREPLGLQDEWVFEVAGLPVPEDADAVDSVLGTAVELFLQRARRAHVGFHAAPEEYPAIRRICRLVEGMPLGIELAASWVRVLSCEEIAREIERGLDFLTTSARDLPARHSSMRAVFDHSWKLLAEDERETLRRLSVFRGGFRREAAESAAGARLNELSALMTKSLIRRDSAGRYDLHELIRQFAGEQYAECPSELAETQARLGRYYLNFFADADERLRSSAQNETLAGLSAEIDNFRAAWDWTVKQNEFGLLETTLRTFALFTDIRGWYEEGLDAVERAASVLQAASQVAAPARVEQIALSHLWVCEGLFAMRLGRHEQAKTALARSLDILHQIDEPRVLVEAVTFLGLASGLTGDYERGAALFAEGLEAAARIGDRWFAALCRVSQIDLDGFVSGSLAPDEIHRRFKEVMVDIRATGDPRFTAIGLNGLSLSAQWLGQYDEARRSLEESLSLAKQAGDRWGVGFAYRGLGLNAQAQGEHEQAIEMFGRSLESLKELGARQDTARVQADMGWSLLALGEDGEAERLWREAVRASIETGATFITLEALVGLAGLLVKQGEGEKALEYVLAVLDHPAIVPVTREHAARLEAQLREKQVEAARARGFDAIVVEVMKPGSF